MTINDIPMFFCRYLTNFLSVRDSYAPAHELMGQICEQLNDTEKAVSSYKRSLELDDKQRDVLIKVAQLHCQLLNVHVDTMRVGTSLISIW